MNGWGAAALGALAGAAVIVAVEADLVGHVLGRVSYAPSEANGYKLGMFWLPAVAGMNEAIGVSLSHNGAPVQDAAVAVSIAKQSGTIATTRHTDNLGLFVVDVTAFHGQMMKVTATYNDPTTGKAVVQDQATVGVSEPTVAGNGG